MPADLVLFLLVCLLTAHPTNLSRQSRACRGATRVGRPPPGEPFPQQSRALLLAHARHHDQLMVEARVGAQVVERAASSRLGVGGGEDQAMNPRRTGHPRTSGRVPGSRRRWRRTDARSRGRRRPAGGRGSRRGRWDRHRPPGGCGRADHPAPGDNHRADRRLAGSSGAARLLDCQPHAFRILHRGHGSAWAALAWLVVRAGESGSGRRRRRRGSGSPRGGR